MLQKIKIEDSNINTINLRLRQFSRYMATGFFSVSIEFSILLLLVEAHGLNYLMANFIAFIVINLCNYFISRHWIFEKGKHEQYVEIIIFFITAGIGLGINQVVLGWMVEYLSIDYRISKLAAIGLVAIWNFWTRKKLVFKG